MWRYATTIFLSAFLLFQVQPIVGKYILPWFGSTPAVWSSTLVFFQFVLMLGYAYAHLVVRLPKRSSQFGVHSALLVLAVATLPIRPNESWIAASSIDPVWQILLLLALSVGAPYFMVASTSPLLQHWFAHVNTGKSPYRLYALSNAGSLLALMTYPFLVEPYVTLDGQVVTWSVLFGAFAGLSMLTGGSYYRTADYHVPTDAHVSDEESRRPSPARIMAWVALPALGSVALMSTINKLTTDLPAVPFLFILPLSLYLVTYIIAFDSPRWYYRPFFLILLPLFVIFATLYDGVFDGVFKLLFLSEESGNWSVVQNSARLTLYCLTMFFVCMSCHGELARSKPHPAYLTLFYFLVALGGVIGGILVAIFAPLVFTEIWEYPLGLAASVALVSLLVASSIRRKVSTEDEPISIHGFRFRKRTLRWMAIGSVVGGLLVASAVSLSAVGRSSRNDRSTEALSRNFYGTLRVSRDEVARHLWHGQILHGSQFLDPSLRDRKTTYYGDSTGVGIAISEHPKRKSGLGLKVAGIGLGVGTIASYARDEKDTFRFYEINPAVTAYARSHFDFLDRAESRGAQIDVVHDDARIALRKETDTGATERFDIMAIDAFSGDSVPMHLLTIECMKLYESHLADDGILAFHISNRYLDLVPVVQGLASAAGMSTVAVQTQRNLDTLERTSLWILLTRNERFLRDPVVQSHSIAIPSKAIEWTDSFHSLFDVVKF